MLPTTLGFLEDMSRRSVATLEILRFFLRVLVTMISKRFVKLGIILYYRSRTKYDAMIICITLHFLFTHPLKRAWKNARIKSKIFKKSFLNFFFRKDHYYILDFVISDNTVLREISQNWI